MMDPRTLDILADDRLLRLPAKTRRAFADLLRRGFMSNETAELLLMATELGGEPRRLLGFRNRHARHGTQRRAGQGRHPHGPTTGPAGQPELGARGAGSANTTGWPGSPH